MKIHGFVPISVILWFVLFCVLIWLAVTSDIKAKPSYFDDTNKKQDIVTGIKID